MLISVITYVHLSTASLIRAKGIIQLQYRKAIPQASLIRAKVIYTQFLPLYLLLKVPMKTWVFGYEHFMDRDKR